MKLITFAVLFFFGLFLSACSLETNKTNLTPTPTTVIPATAILSPTNKILPPLTDESKSENWNNSPKIISISDNLENNFDMICDEALGCLTCHPKDKEIPLVSLKSTSEIKITVEARDPNDRPIKFRFYSNDDSKDWGDDNFFSYFTKSDSLGKVSLAVRIKNDDYYNNAPSDCDAYSIIDYEVKE